MKKGKAQSPQMRQQYKRAQEMNEYKKQMEDSQVRGGSRRASAFLAGPRVARLTVPP
jgi:hypothetical protein